MNPKVKAFIENAQEKQQKQAKQERDKLLVSLGLTDGVERKYIKNKHSAVDSARVGLCFDISYLHR